MSESPVELARIRDDSCCRVEDTLQLVGRLLIDVMTGHSSKFAVFGSWRKVLRGRSRSQRNRGTQLWAQIFGVLRHTPTVYMRATKFRMMTNSLVALQTRATKAGYDSQTPVL